VALIGDAVHAIPPVLAQGANQSIEDAWVLARELQTAPTVPQALARYQAERRRKVSMVSRAARGPALPLYGAASLMPRRIPVVTERFCTFAWRMVLQSASSTIPLARTSR
jgi:2-polyprenyl-6-methoxyphenol hydroxylase-like FAD-dependent oxidoreductase